MGFCWKNAADSFRRGYVPPLHLRSIGQNIGVGRFRYTTPNVLLRLALALCGKRNSVAMPVSVPSRESDCSYCLQFAAG